MICIRQQRQLGLEQPHTMILMIMDVDNGNGHGDDSSLINELSTDTPATTDTRVQSQKVFDTN
jgi:hypothetical protein